MQTKGFNVRNNIIYVQGRVDGKRYRISTNKEATEANLKWIKKNARDVLLKLIDKQKPMKYDLASFGLEVIEMSSHRRGAAIQKEYISKFDNYILPYFKHYQFSDIKVYDLEKWQSMLLKKFSTSSVIRVKYIFSMIMKKAVANEIIDKNPFDYVDSFKVVSDKKTPYTIDEMTMLIKESTGFLKLYLNIAFTTGMRVGEILALRWDDVDFDKGIIYINGAVSRGSVIGSNDRKNHNRISIIPQFVLSLLMDHKTNDEWIFRTTREDKPYYNGNYVSKKMFKPLLKKLNIEDKTLYATRHTFISLMRNEGVSMNFIQELVGHSDGSRITDKNYTTLQMTSTKINAINNVFDGFKIDSFGHKLDTAQN